MKKYKAKFYLSPSIEIVDVVKETDKFVCLESGRRDAKTSECQSYHDTFEEAKNKLISVFEEKAQGARRILEVTNSHLGNAKGLKQTDA